MGDTSGLDHSENGGVITWDVGTLEPGQNNLFMVTLGMLPETIAPGEIDPNQVSIALTDLDANTDNNENTSEVALEGNNTFDLELTVLPDEYAIYLPLILRNH